MKRARPELGWNRKRIIRRDVSYCLTAITVFVGSLLKWAVPRARVRRIRPGGIFILRSK